MTAGSWIYIGTQGILQGTYETFAEAATQRFGGTLAGTVRSRRARRDGRRAAARRDDERGRRSCASRSTRRASSGASRRATSIDESDDLDEALDRVDEARRAARRVSIGLVGNAPRSSPSSLARGVRARRRHRPDVRARRAQRLRPGRAVASRRPLGCARTIPPSYDRASFASMARARRAMLGFQDARRGDVRLRQQPPRPAPRRRADETRSRIPGFVPAFIRPLFCEGKGPFRWAALSGDPEDIATTDRAIVELFPDDERARTAGSRWPRSASRSRGCRRGSAGSATASARRPGLRFNELVARESSRRRS